MPVRRRHLLAAVALAAVVLAAGAGAVALILTAPATGVAGPIVFLGDWESGDIDRVRWQLDREKRCAIDVVDTPVRAGERAARFVAGPGARCEVVPWIERNALGKQKREPFHEDRWYGFSVFLPDGYRPDEQNEIIAQWHGTRDVFFLEDRGRGPPIALRIEGSDWRLSYGFDRNLVSTEIGYAKETLWREPYRDGEWTDWVLKVRWSPADDGETRVWRNGEPIVTYHGPNTYNDLRGVYLKLGNYHPGVERTIYIDELRIGNADADYDRVAPPGERVPAR